MLYLDYSRKEGQWTPNVYGGRENLEAISLLQDLNRELYGRFHDVQTIATLSVSQREYKNRALSTNFFMIIILPFLMYFSHKNMKIRRETHEKPMRKG